MQKPNRPYYRKDTDEQHTYGSAARTRLSDKKSHIEDDTVVIGTEGKEWTIFDVQYHLDRDELENNPHTAIHQAIEKTHLRNAVGAVSAAGALGALSAARAVMMAGRLNPTSRVRHTPLNTEVADILPSLSIARREMDCALMSFAELDKLHLHFGYTKHRDQNRNKNDVWHYYSAPFVRDRPQNDEVCLDDKPKVRNLAEIAKSPRVKRPVVRAVSIDGESAEESSRRLMKAARIVAKEHHAELKALVHQ